MSPTPSPQPHSSLSSAKSVSFHTLGCKLNTYDTEWYREQFEQNGYRVVPFGETADVTVINTCTVTGAGDAQSRRALRRGRRASPEGVMVAVGCYAQADPEALVDMPEVDLVVGTAERTQLLDLVNDTCSIGRSFVSRGRTAAFQEMDIVNFGLRSRAFVKVQEGCNEFCSFCIIPFARGRSRSRSVEGTRSQVSRLVDAGHLEVVLTGVHIGDYDHEGAGLVDILEAVASVPGLRRYRVSSIEATFVTPELIDFLAGSETFCRHLHVPLQSGSDVVLTAMRRPYDSSRYRETVEALADHMPDLGIGADVMVGFPGETDACFEETRSLIETAPLVYLHVFPYSPRGGTPAAKLPCQVPPELKKERGALLRDLGEAKRLAFQDRFVGTEADVLFEEVFDRKTGFLQGLTGNYVRVYAPGPEAACDQIRRVRIDRVEDGRAIAEPLVEAGGLPAIAERPVSDGRPLPDTELLQIGARPA